jgi:hypothetical protein
MTHYIWAFGEAVDFRLTMSTIPDSLTGWTVVLRIGTLGSAATVSVTVPEVSPGVFEVSRTAAQLSALTPGKYAYGYWNTTSNKLLADGPLTVRDAVR